MRKSCLIIVVGLVILAIGSAYAGDVVGDPNWGFKFTVPAGWKYQNDYSGALLGHDTIPGLIVVMPHTEKGADAVKAGMLEGLQEGQTRLMLKGKLESVGKSAVAGLYEGVYEGEQAKARGIGTYSPHGGGAFIIGVSTPQMYGDKIKAAADAIAKSMQYVKVEASNLMRHFAGKWTNFTTNTQTSIYLFGDGSYSDHYESSYGGDLTNQYGDTTATWMSGANQNTQGRWSIRGDKRQGTITINYNNGNVDVIEYSVHVENGQVYWSEYKLNGAHYSKSRE